MNRLIFILGLVSLVSHAQPSMDKETARQIQEKMMQGMSQFNPANTLKGYTSNPQEAQIVPDNLKAHAEGRLQTNKTAEEIMHEARTRTRIHNNPDSLAMKQAEQLIENADSILGTGIGCANGSCDETKDEVSNDMAEGVSRLGALSGTASGIAGNNSRFAPRVFAGSAMECKKHPLGIRDCCTDSGWGDWVKHCPSDMQVLQRAKQEGRAAYLGNYKRKKLGSRRHVYCVFSSKLAGIIQMEGRYNQLHVDFGEPEEPNCRGLTASELERLDFAAFNLAPIEQELISRFNAKDAGHVQAVNSAHIERLHNRGVSHD